MLTIPPPLIELLSVIPSPWPMPGTLLAPTSTVTSTATAPITPTATAVSTSTLPTAVPPVATPIPPPWQSGGGWLADTGWSMLYHLPLLVIFLALGVAALVLYFYFSRRRYATHTLNARLTEFLAGVLGAFSVVGLLLLVCAFFALPFLSLPIWPAILIVALLGFGGYAIWYYLRRYPARRAAYERETVKQRYMPAARERTKTTTPSKPAPSNQRRRKKRKKR